MTAVTVFVLGFALLFFGLLTFAAARKMAEVRRMRRWAATSGTVIASAARSRRTSKRDVELGTFAQIEYEYVVGGRKLRGRRVSVAEEVPNVGVQQRLLRYPPGAAVTVYYNPAQPRDAVLERDLGPNFGRWLGIAYLYFGAIFGFALFALTDLPRVVSGVIHQGSASLLVVIAGGGGAFCVLLAIALQREAAAARAWRTTTATVLKSHVVRSLESDVDGTGESIYFRPRIVYEYSVDGQTYRSDRLSFGGLIRTSLAGLARRQADRYRPGAQVTAYYNPVEPSEAVLQPRAAGVWVLWAASVLLIGTAWFLST